MTDREKVIKGLEKCKRYECDNCTEKGASQAPWDCPAYDDFVDSALALLKEQEVRELTIDEWQEWKNNPKRNPICKLWEHDTSPLWILNPNDVHEPALLMGKLKLFTGKPTFEQCKEVKWE